jgi:hypothetical protein
MFVEASSRVAQKVNKTADAKYRYITCVQILRSRVDQAQYTKIQISCPCDVISDPNHC